MENEWLPRDALQRSCVAAAFIRLPPLPKVECRDHLPPHCKANPCNVRQARPPGRTTAAAHQAFAPGTSTRNAAPSWGQAAAVNFDGGAYRKPCPWVRRLCRSRPSEWVSDVGIANQRPHHDPVALRAIVRLHHRGHEREIGGRHLCALEFFPPKRTPA
jgi:hypothetical protein